MVMKRMYARMSPSWMLNLIIKTNELKSPSRMGYGTKTMGTNIQVKDTKMRSIEGSLNTIIE